jgi:Tol biopolymer transport system component
VIGQKFGSYEVVARLGEGGMGEVYRARDTRLGREVAIKILPAAFRSDPDRLARFDREARSLAALNHPNIAAIHGLEEQPDVAALVLELVEGDTLADRIGRGPLPVPAALGLARQIADGLDAAHERGIVHRDLKPANIMITPDGTVKVLDFGLAKVAAREDVRPDLPQSPTLTFDGTRVGLVLGTPAYMSPEQTRGLAVDKRADIWAFGCVVYEMLTGRQAFGGATITDVLAAVLEREPDWQALPGATPAHVMRLLQRCLEKDPRRRLRDIGDARIELDAASASATAGPIDSRTPRWLPWLIASAATLVAVALAMSRVWNASAGTSPSGVMVERFVEALPAGIEIAPAPALAVSPDGRRMAYVAIQNGARILYVRELDQDTAHSMAGTEGADQPFFSPDGRWIGFFAEGKLKKLSVAGGAPLTLCNAPNPRGGSWAPEDSIVFAPSSASALLRVSAAGGEPRPVTTLDRTLNEASHRWPHVLPGGEVMLYAAGPTVTVDGWMEAHVIGQSLRTGGRRLLAPHGTYPQFLASGSMLYLQGGVVFGQAFDPARLELTGEAIPVLQYVDSLRGVNGGASQFAVSATGTLVYLPDSAPEPQSLAWVDRKGMEKPLAVPAAMYQNPRLSPDERSVAVTVVTTLESDVWVYDVARGTGSRFTSGGRNQWPLWSPDGAHIAYSSSRNGSTNIYRKATDGSGTEEQLTSTSYTNYLQSWSPDGANLAISEVTGDGRRSIVMVALDGTPSPTPFRQERANQGAFSPDGRWFAYASAESGQANVYARSYPGLGSPIQISAGGGQEPAWARDGRELFFRRGDAMMAVEIGAGQGNTLLVGPAKQLFTGAYSPDSTRVGYDVARDGRFLMVKRSRSRPDPTRFNVVLNWDEELKARVSRAGRSQ